MIVTEEEAKTKRCQESFGPGQMSPDGSTVALTGYGSSFAVQTSPSMCIGSRCMAWRIAVKADPGHVHSRNTTTGKTYYVKGTEQPAKGYCGKAGKP